MGFDSRRFCAAALLAGVAGGCYLGGGPGFSSSSDAGKGGKDGGLRDGSFWPDFDSGGVPDAGIPTSSSAIRPTFDSTTTASVAPPPISGGTLLVTGDGHRAIAADPDRDRVYGVDLGSDTLTYTVSLQNGDEPGRVVEDGNGRVHVALRGGGALVTIDEATGQVLSRRAVCPAPRGVAWDYSTDLVWVACATGELVALPASGGPATSRFTVERDLRDVVASGGSVSVSKFRSAEVLRLASDATITRRDHAPALLTQFAAQVAWRTVAGPAGRLVLIHQAETTVAIPSHSTGAYGGCNGGPPPPPPPSQMPIDAGADGAADLICGTEKLANFANVKCDELPGAVVGALTVFAADGTVLTNRLFPGSLPVDLAMSRDGSQMAFIAAGNAKTSGLDTVFRLTPCGDFTGASKSLGQGKSEQPIAIAFDAASNVVVQTREPATLWRIDGSGNASAISLSSISREDTGHDIFHTQAGAMIACASCHPEGGDDSHVWDLDMKPRRTPSLRGTVAGTAPYHWFGDETSFDALVDDVYTTRMNGALLAADQKDAVSHWVQAIPAPKMPSWVDASSAIRGRALFESTSVGCASCHSGEKLTDNLTVNVGTGASFQVPPLVGVGWRTPLMHDGCAATMADRFGKCSTPGHGNLTGLSTGDIVDLTSYLETL